MATDPPIPLHRRFVWLVLLVGVLLARGFTPDGWMPATNAAGQIEITLCPGSGPVDGPMTMSMDLSHDQMDHKAPAKGQASDHPCAFAGIGLADTTAALPSIVAPLRPVAALPGLPNIVAAPGHGLAAPPPPATGPPALA